MDLARQNLAVLGGALFPIGLDGEHWHRHVEELGLVAAHRKPEEVAEALFEAGHVSAADAEERVEGLHLDARHVEEQVAHAAHVVETREQRRDPRTPRPGAPLTDVNGALSQIEGTAKAAGITVTESDPSAIQLATGGGTGD